LSQDQQIYAALDAHSLLGLFVAMTNERSYQPSYQITLLTSRDDNSSSFGVIDEVVWRTYVSSLK
jgi:hypothetical protein